MTAMRTRQDFSEEIVRRIVAIIEAPETLRDDLVGEVYAEERAKAEKEIERLRGCTCDVFDISEGGGHDPRACGEHGYPAGVRDGREESAKELTAAKERIAQPAGKATAAGTQGLLDAAAREPGADDGE